MTNRPTSTLHRWWYRARMSRSMLLCLSSRLTGAVGDGLRSGCWWEVLVDLSCDVALDAADDLAFGSSLGGATLDVIACGLMVAHSDDGHDVKGAVCCSISAPAESMAARGAAAAGWLGCDAAELGEGGFAMDPFGVVACCDEELAGDLDTDALELE